MSGESITTFSNMLKDYFTDTKRVAKVAYKKRPLLGALQKKTVSASGKAFIQPILWGDAPAGSADFTKAQDRGSSTSTYSSQFTITYETAYSNCHFERTVVKASRNADGAWLEAQAAVIDSKMNDHAMRLEADLFGDGSGILGTSETLSNSNKTVALTSRYDVRKFKKGYKLLAVDPATDTARTAAGNGLIVVSTSAKNGTVTFAADVTTLATGFTVADYFVVDGDQDARAVGLKGWLPTEAISASDSFFGVNRSDSEFLQPRVVDAEALGLSVKDGLLEASAECSSFEVDPDMIIAHPSQYLSLQRDFGSNLNVPLQMRDMPIAVDTFSVPVAGKMVPVIQNPNCDENLIYFLDSSQIFLATLGDKLIEVGTDGEVVRWRDALDAAECRIATDWAVVVPAPCKHLVLKVAA